MQEMTETVITERQERRKEQHQQRWPCELWWQLLITSL